VDNKHTCKLQTLTSQHVTWHEYWHLTQRKLAVRIVFSRYLRSEILDFTMFCRNWHVLWHWAPSSFTALESHCRKNRYSWYRCGASRGLSARPSCATCCCALALMRNSTANWVIYSVIYDDADGRCTVALCSYNCTYNSSAADHFHTRLTYRGASRTISRYCFSSLARAACMPREL